MIIEFKYSVVHDLMYHILAHMKVENASNLYSEAYIDNVNKIKNGVYESIAEAVSHLSNYYKMRTLKDWESSIFCRLCVLLFKT